MTSTWPDAVRLAVGTLTALRVRPPAVVDRTAGRRAMLLAPLVGAGLGLLAAGVMLAAEALRLAPLVATGLALVTLALATRGLHLDGLADTADGLGSSVGGSAAGDDAARERALTVMRRGDVGPLGAATLVLVLLLQVTALAGLVDQPPTGPGEGLVVRVVLAVALSRLALPLACRRGIPAARPDGLGAVVSGTVPGAAAVAVVVVVLLAGSGLVMAVGRDWGATRGVLAALALVILVTTLLVRCAVRRLGGITGDVLGAGVELALTAALVVLSAW